MIERQYGQHHLGEIFLKDSIDDCWEPWMKKADEILDDEELIDAVYEALRRRRPNSATRGRKGTPAEVALRLLVLKHMRNWSFETLEREVRPNMVYRVFTRVGAEKVPDAKTLARIERGKYSRKCMIELWGSRAIKKLSKGEECESIRRSPKPTSYALQCVRCSMPSVLLCKVEERVFL